MAYRNRSVNRYYFATGALAALFPFFVYLALHAPEGFRWVRCAIAAFAGGCELAAARVLLRNPRLGKMLGGIALVGAGVLLWPWISVNPFWALLFFAGAVVAAFALLDPEFASVSGRERAATERRIALGASLFVLLGSASAVFAGAVSLPGRGCLAASGLTALGLFWRWAWRRERWLRRIGTAWSLLGGAILLGGMWFACSGALTLVTALVSTVLLFGLRGGRGDGAENASGWELVSHYPARILFMTFFLLCVFGALLLNLPGTEKTEIGILDAAFTAVSAACVTGLTTLNSAADFTVLGQCFILLLIQLGGIGIMTIATVLLFTVGRRLSLAQERVMATMADSDRRDLAASLKLVLRFTFCAEAAGSMVLIWAFRAAGVPWEMAFREGVFTSVSAFCNAGFTLDPASLTAYRGNGPVLWTVAVLVLLGGLAPATGILIPRWIAGRPVPLTAHLALTTTALLILLGGVGFTLFEWNGILKDLPPMGKWNNACFLAISARTAGFNSVEMNTIGAPALLLLVFQMFIGGSPGGTAGGVRTVTFAVLVLAFWTEIVNRREIVVANRRISPRIVIRAMTIVAASLLIASLTLLMLLVTQPIPARELLFETVSALGTAGLSIGATPRLDGMGKIIVMLTMFIGRIGPMSLFWLLSEQSRYSSAYYPDAKITLT